MEADMTVIDTFYIDAETPIIAWNMLLAEHPMPEKLGAFSVNPELS
jgi:hypothetical protein